MAEEISDGQFKAEMLDFKTEMMRFVETASKKFDGLTADIRTNTFKLDHTESRLGRVEEKIDLVDQSVGHVEENVGRVEADLKSLASDVKVLSGQFSDVGVMAIGDHKRIDNIEDRVGILESEAH